MGGATASVGFFGKLPGAGDFVQRRLPATFVERWDAHFERAVHASREALREGWAQAWRASPVWRFVLAPRVCGESAWAGVLGPSEDRVGRSFPMVLAAPVTAAQVEPLLRDGQAWFEALAQAQVQGQRDPSLDAAAFDARVTALPPPQTPPVPAAFAALDFGRGGHWRLPLATRPVDGAALAALWQRLGDQGGWCLWWNEGAGCVPAAVLATQGLPAPDTYAGFLDAACTAGWRTPPGFAAAVPAVAVQEPPARAVHPVLDEDVTVPGVCSVAPPIAAPPVQDVASPAQVAHGMLVVRDAALALTLVAADAGMPDPRRRAAAAVAAAVTELSPVDEAAPGMCALRARLMALHPHLRHAAANEDGAVVAARLAHGQAGLLRIGAAGAWHWRAGRLRPLFAAAPARAGLPGGGELDDLLFGGEAPVPGLGTDGTPVCEQLACEVLPGDRLVLLAGAPHAQLSPAALVQALAAASAEEAQARLALALDPTHPRPWPLAVLEVQP